MVDLPAPTESARLRSPGQELGRVFLGEDIFTNGMCVSHDKQVDSQAMCAVDFY